MVNSYELRNTHQVCEDKKHTGIISERVENLKEAVDYLMITVQIEDAVEYYDQAFAAAVDAYRALSELEKNFVGLYLYYFIPRGELSNLMFLVIEKASQKEPG